MVPPENLTCPLCLNPGAGLFAGRNRAGKTNAYFCCRSCGLVFLDPALRLDRNSEKARYDLHRNHPEDAGYVRFLEKLAVPLGERLPPGAKGLDFGCGPGPVLARLMSKAGFPAENYDPFYFPDPAPLGKTYDFVTCTEVVEHLHDPAREFERLDRLLRPGGWLGIMTKVLLPGQEFEKWWYPDDPTHVCFYRPETLAWIAKRYGWKMETPEENVILFRKGIRP